MLPDDLSPEVEHILWLAKEESLFLEHFYIGIEHVFIALTKTDSGITHDLLLKHHVHPIWVRSAICRFVGKGDGHRYWDDTPLTPRCQSVLAMACEIASSRNDEEISEDVLLASILLEGEGIPVRILRTRGVHIPRMILSLERKEHSRVKEKISSRPQRTPLLDTFGRDLTLLAEKGKIDPVIGRENEIIRLMRTLTRRNKNNPILLGEAGVGKTAIVEGLANKMSQGELPQSLQNKRIIELSLASIVANTKYRGEYEERLMGIINESREHPEVILFLDEMHTVLTAGASEGGLDAANILKPALARGEIRCIGATTMAEYRKHIERDPALERRFQPVIVDEPSPSGTLEILKRLREQYETHHNVDIDLSAIEAAVDLSVKFIHDRYLPDKALDALDEACAAAKIPSLDESGEDTFRSLESQRITGEDVAKVISQWTGIPVTQLTVEDREKLLHMADIVRGRVVGQDNAVEKVTSVVRMARSGLKNPKHPIGVFIFIGNTGVGKTELAKALAEVLFGTEEKLIRLDMSEFMEQHSVAKLIGAPPGYVGYEEEGRLTGALRSQPYSVVLLDEIEKAHPDIFDLFLQVFDEGRLTDSKGRTVNAQNAIFIMTSNIGTEVCNKAPMGFQRNGEIHEEPMYDLRKKLSATFRPEFLNRVDDIIVFNRLGQEALNQIANNLLDNLKQRLSKNGLLLTVEQAALELICHKGHDPVNGARPLSRVIERIVTVPLSEMIIAGGLVPGNHVIVGVENGEISFVKTDEEAPEWLRT